MRTVFHSRSWMLGLLLFAMQFCGCTDDAEGIVLSVKNESGVPIEEVVASFSGGNVRLGAVASGAVREGKIKPTGDSHIEIEIRTGDGQIERRTVDTYIEPGYRGRIDVSLGIGFVVNSSEKLDIR